MTAVLLDTGCIVALLDESEQHHERVVASLQSINGPLITCEAVIAESCYLLRRVSGAADAVLENVAKGSFQLPFQLTRSSPGVRTLMRKYADVPMDFADACLVQIAIELGIGKILTLDQHFGIYRWGRNRPFEMLVPR